MNYTSEENFDELKPEYLQLLSKPFPSIMNIDDLNSIFDFALNYKKNKFMPSGLLGSYLLAEKEKFFNRKFGFNIDLDKSIYYAIAVNMFIAISYNSLLEDIFNTARNIFTKTLPQQEIAINNEVLSLSFREMHILGILFIYLSTQAERWIEELSIEAGNSYQLIKLTIDGSHFDVRTKMIIKTSVDRLIKVGNID